MESASQALDFLGRYEASTVLVFESFSLTKGFCSSRQ